MRPITNLALGLAVGVAIATAGFAAFAQMAQNDEKDPAATVTVNDPIGPKPDPARIGMTLPQDIKCTGKEGVQQMCYLFGDPAKPGPYMVKYIWYPGHFSRPHYHNNVRFAYVVSGTWWTSSSNVYDPRTTYPVHAGSVAVDKLRGIHWDGCRAGEKQPAVLILAGTGPNITQQVDENGKDKGAPR